MERVQGAGFDAAASDGADPEGGEGGGGVSAREAGEGGEEERVDEGVVEGVENGEMEEREGEGTEEKGGDGFEREDHGCQDIAVGAKQAAVLQLKMWFRRGNFPHNYDFVGLLYHLVARMICQSCRPCLRIWLLGKWKTAL